MNTTYRSPEALQRLNLKPFDAEGRALTPFVDRKIGSRGFYIRSNGLYQQLARSIGIADFSFYLANPPQFEVQSQFNKAFEFDPKKLKLAYAIGATLNGAPKSFESLSAFGFRVWDSSEPLSITVELKFFKGMWGIHSAREEVFNPMMLLAQTILPTEEAGGILVSPSPNYFIGMQKMIQAFVMVANEVAVGSMNFIGKLGGFVTRLTEGGKKLSNEVIQMGANILMSYASTRSRSRGTYNLVFGNVESPSMVFYNMIAESASPQFSLDVDTEGFPISGTLRMTYKSMFSADISHLPMRFRKKALQSNPGITST